MTVIATAEIDVRLRNDVSKGATQIKKDLKDVEKSAQKTTESVSKTGDAKTNPLVAIATTFSPRLKKMNKDIGGLTASMGESSQMAGVMGLAIKGAIAGVAVGAAVSGVMKLYSAMRTLVEFASPTEYTQVTMEFNQAVANLKQTVGTWMTPAFLSLTQIMTQVVEGLNETAYSLIRISSSVRNIFGLGNAFEDLSTSVDAAQGSMASFDKLSVLGSNEYTASLETAEKIEEASQGSKDIWQDTLDIMKSCPLVLVNLYGQLGQIGKDVWDTVSGFFSGIDWEGIGNGIISTYTGIFNKIGELFSSIDWQGIGEGISSAFNTVFNNIGAFFGSIGDYFSSIDWQGIGNGIISSIEGIFNGVDWSGIAGRISSIFSNVFSGITGTLKGVGNSLIAIVNRIIDAYNSSIGSLRIDNDLINIHIGFPTLSHLPMLASGGVIDADSPMPVIVGDNRTQKEAIAPVDTLKQYVKEAVSEASTGNSRQNITLEISGRRLATLMYDYNKAEASRRSATIRS